MGALAADRMPKRTNGSGCVEKIAKPRYERLTRRREMRIIVTLRLVASGLLCLVVVEGDEGEPVGVSDNARRKLMAVGITSAKIIARVTLVTERKRLASKFFQCNWYSEKSTRRGGRPTCNPNESASIVARIGRLFLVFEDESCDGPRIEREAKL